MEIRKKYKHIQKKLLHYYNNLKNLVYDLFSPVVICFTTSQKTTTKYFHFFINLFVINHAPLIQVEGVEK